MISKKSQSKSFKDTIHLGGKDGERLYLANLNFRSRNGRQIKVKKTMIPGVDMKDLVARSVSRYGLLALFSRPGYSVLDFPCGSGYAAEFLNQFGVVYEGREFDSLTVEYANKMYSTLKTSFSVGNLCSPKLHPSCYDIIGCIEGLEHIDKQYQPPLIEAFYKALKPGGTLIVSSPENTSGVSGPSKDNPYHLWELNKSDFLALLHTKFKPENVELITYKAVLSYGTKMTTCFFGICRKA